MTVLAPFALCGSYCTSDGDAHLLTIPAVAPPCCAALFPIPARRPRREPGGCRAPDSLDPYLRPCEEDKAKKLFALLIYFLSRAHTGTHKHLE